jgi:hypothetical protein
MTIYPRVWLLIDAPKPLIDAFEPQLSPSIICFVNVLHARVFVWSVYYAMFPESKV